MTDWLLPALAGFGTGILSAWGVGGGTLLLLLMTLFLGVDQTQAQGINLLYFLPTAGMSLLEHRKNGYLDREVMRAAIPLGTLAALAAAWAATSVDITVFRKPFGVFLLWAGANMLLQNKKCDTARSIVSVLMRSRSARAAYRAPCRRTGSKAYSFSTVAARRSRRWRSAPAVRGTRRTPRP